MLFSTKHVLCPISKYTLCEIPENVGKLTAGVLEKCFFVVFPTLMNEEGRRSVRQHSDRCPVCITLRELPRERTLRRREQPTQRRDDDEDGDERCSIIISAQLLPQLLLQLLRRYARTSVCFPAIISAVHQPSASDRQPRIPRRAQRACADIPAEPLNLLPSQRSSSSSSIEARWRQSRLQRGD